MSVPADSWEAENWPTRKPRVSRVEKEVKQQQRRIEKKVESAVVRAVSSPRRTTQAVTTAVGSALGVGVKSGAVVALNSLLVLAAGIGSYYATTKILQEFRRWRGGELLADLNLAVANQYRAARNELAVKAGTPWAQLDPRVQQQLKLVFDREISRNREVLRIRTAMENAQANIRQYQSQLGR